jgi:predicted transcriptional regulator
MEATVNFRLPVELKARIETLAKRSLISVADVARIAVIEKLERDEQPEATAANPSTVEVQP